jgi:hypothetical protein
MAKTTQVQRGNLVFRLLVTSSTLAMVETQRADGTVLERREFVGSRAEPLAMWAWAKATKLVGGQAA